MRGSDRKSRIIAAALAFGLLPILMVGVSQGAELNCAVEAGNVTGSTNAGIAPTFFFPRGGSGHFRCLRGANLIYKTRNLIIERMEGTAFKVRVLEDDTSVVTVFEGAVRVADPKKVRSVLVPAGYQVIVKPGELPGEPVRHTEVLPERFFYAPGPGPTNVSTPNAYAAYKGIGFGVISTHGHGTKREGLDAAIAAGVGFLEPGAGVEITLTMGDVDRFGSFFPSVRGQVQVETPSLPAVAIGVDSIGNMHPEQCQQSPYVVASKTFYRQSVSPLGATTVVSAGWGGRRFGNHPFVSACTTVSPAQKFILEYDGIGLNIGASFYPEEGSFVGLLGVTRLNHPSERLWTISVGRNMEYGLR